MPQARILRRPHVRPTRIASAVALLFVAVPAFAQSSDAGQGSVNLAPVVISGSTPVTLNATESAPSQNSLQSRTPQSTVGEDVVRNFIAPVADYTQIIDMTPGAFSFQPNGVGLGDSKVTIRGLNDGNSVISFDGIPFNDTNGVSHHSWAFFPSQFLGGVVVDRSPGTAASIGQATYGGTIDLRSRALRPDRGTNVTVSDGSWNTRLYDVENFSGDFGPNGSSNLWIDAHRMTSDGYQTYNDQNRNGFAAKYQYTLSPDTVFTGFVDYLDLTSNTPSIKGVSRANYNVGNYTALMSGSPSQPNYYGYNFYDVPTVFAYMGVDSKLGDGWVLQDKFYHYSYHNKQNYNGSTISATSGVDKLNSYYTTGNVLRLSKDMATGTLNTGVWLEHAYSHRFQTPSNPLTWVDTQASNFQETYQTDTAQPYVEYVFKPTDKLSVTPGVKYAFYRQNFLHYQDNGGAVGPLGGTYNSKTGTITGGMPTVADGAVYHDVLPSLDAHYMIQPNWSAYAQYAWGDQIPDTGVFDVTGGKVGKTPDPTRAKAMQFGTVWNSPKLTLSADVYRIKLDGTYTASSPDAFGNVNWFASGGQTARGIEAEANYAIGGGFSVYGNFTVGSLKYDDSGKWVQGAPRDTEALALNYITGPWKAALQLNRVGQMYYNGKNSAGTVYEAFQLDPVLVTNLFVNYTIRTPIGFVKQTKLALGVNNLLNRHDIVGIASATSGSTSAAPSAKDLLTILPERQISLTATFSF